MNKTNSEAAVPTLPDGATVRAANTADVPALCSLVREYWEHESLPGFDEARIAGLLQAALASGGGAHAWLVLDGAYQPMGYLLAVTQFSLEYGGLAAEIDEFYLVPQARGRGLGIALLTAAESLLQARGVRCLQLQLATDNLSAREFYRRHGFTRRAGYELWEKPLLQLSLPPA